MKPILFNIGSVTFPSYTFLILVGVMVAVFVGIRLSRRLGLPVIYTLDMAIIGIVAGFIGGRIGHILAEAPHYYLEDPWRFFYFWQGGFTSWGAHIGLLLSWYFYLSWRKQPVWAYFDLAAMCVFLTIFFGRTGCLLNGCCYGLPTDFFIHLRFSDHPFYSNIDLHATQIYLMLNVLLVQMAIWIVAKKWWHFQGQLFSLALLLYPVGRIPIEFLRGDVDRGVYFDGWISTGQIVMLFYLAAGSILYLRLKKKAIAPPQWHR